MEGETPGDDGSGDNDEDDKGAKARSGDEGLHDGSGGENDDMGNMPDGSGDNDEDDKGAKARSGDEGLHDGSGGENDDMGNMPDDVSGHDTVHETKPQAGSSNRWGLGGRGERQGV